MKPRATLRRNEPTRADKQAARITCYSRARAFCQLHLSPKCLVGPLPFDGPVMARAHLCHTKSKRRYGWMESDVQKHLLSCFFCHIEAQHNAGGKPVKQKSGMGQARPIPVGKFMPPSVPLLPDGQPELQNHQESELDRSASPLFPQASSPSRSTVP